MQELTARVCRELERRLDARGALPEPDAMALLRVDEIVALVHGRGLPADLHERRAAELAGALGTPLPAEFRLGNDGSAVPVARQGARPEAGVPAGGGRAVGRAVHGSTRRPPAPGDVLVVRELQPGLAAYLPGLAGLVAETGSTLSHLAILAREYDVPAVVAVHDALRRFPAGSRVFVDGGTGDVRIVNGSGPS
ncbi:MAG: PEP-utilizing enzyme [Nocardioides sp.]